MPLDATEETVGQTFWWRVYHELGFTTERRLKFACVASETPVFASDKDIGWYWLFVCVGPERSLRPTTLGGRLGP